jgi:predicted transcriptional regulator
MSDTESQNAQLLRLAADIVCAHVSNNVVPVAEMSGFLRKMHDTLVVMERGATTNAPLPFTPIAASVQHDHLVCLEDGRKLRTLKRYLMARYGLTPEQYRRKWGLPDDYPMAAPALSELRRGKAEATGLGKAKGIAREKRNAAVPKPGKVGHGEA